MTMSGCAPEVGSLWRETDGGLVRVMAVTDRGITVRAANAAGVARPLARAWLVNPAWFAEWSRVR